jgi:hypothetical protein
MSAGLVPLFGKWFLNTNGPVLSVDFGEAEQYWIPLDGPITAAGTLDWIAQIAGKSWAAAADVGDLVRSLDYLLEFQENLCGFGRAGAIEDPELLALQRIEHSALPCEQDEIRRRVGDLFTAQEWDRAERDVVAERHDAGRYPLSTHARDRLARVPTA